MDEQELLKRLREAFMMESGERLASLSDRLLELEKVEDEARRQEILEVVYREAHSLKGAARAVNLTEIEAICQSMESVFGAMNRREITRSNSLFDTLHEVVNFIERNLAVEQEHLDQEEIKEILAKLEDLHKGAPAPKKKGGTPPAKAQGKPAAAAQAPDEQPAPPKPGAARPVSPPAGKSPAPVSSSPSPAGAGQEVQESPPGKKEASAPPKKSPGQPEQPAPKQPAASRNPYLTNTVRIATVKLDRLLLKAEDMISLKLTGSQGVHELKQLRNLFDHWQKKWAKTDIHFRRLRKELSQKEELAESGLAEIDKFLDWNQDFIKSIHRDIRTLTRSAEQNQRFLDRKISHFLEEMKGVIMMPCSTLLDTFPRMIRELARSQGKKIELDMKGSDIEIDRRILEELKDPLIHLIRNSVDHGLEKPDERTRLQKSERGRIKIHITQLEGGKVEIVIGDDGRGIDPDKVRKTAVRKGLLTEKDAAKLSDREAQGLIFHSGLSTASMITQLSGRGLGMAIFMERVEKLGGQLDYSSVPGRETTFTIRLPLSLATFRGTLLQVAGELFLAPSSHVKAVMQVRYDAVRTVENRSTITHAGSPLSLVQLADVLQMARPMRRNGKKRFQVMVLGTSKKRIAFGVDAVLAEQEVLFKELGKQLRKVKNIAGATILGSGQVVPILNVHDLLKSAVGSVGVAPILDRSEDKGEQRKSILVVEDSITSRTLLKSILEAAGYRVTTAVDGLDGYNVLKSTDINLVISDVEMPRMNGFELTEKIRADEALADMPLILCTSLASQEDRERGVEVGANAYIVKSNFDQSNLLGVVGKLI